MIELNIPGRGRVQLHHLVCDVNGTLALDALLAADLVAPDIFAVLELLENPLRLVATLRK